MDLRKVVIAEMGKREWTAYKLIKELKGRRRGGKDIPSTTIYEFIRGKTTINSDDLALILDALELGIQRRKGR